MMNGDTPINGNMPQGGGQRGMMMDEETAAAHAITINGGKVSVSAEGDGIDSNGSLVINGGTVIVDGPSSSGNGPLDAEAGISMNGGTVITASSAGMLQMPTAAKGINSLQVFFDGTQNSTTSVSVKEKSTGKELASITPTKNFQAFLFASSELKTGTEYVVYINGAEYQTFTASEGVSTVGSASFGGFGGKGMGGRRGGNV